MLISHRFDFIYIKTLKTAGTSVERYFEPYCVDPERAGPAEVRRTPAVSEWGVVAGGSRLFWERGRVWFNHMPATAVRAAVGEEMWQSYLKFCVVRNPFDAVVSSFWWNMPERRRSRLLAAPFSEVRKAFGRWVRSPFVSVHSLARRQRYEHIPTSRRLVTVDGELAVDEVIRQESLESGVARLCERIGVPWEPERLGRFKSGFNKRPEPFADYYDGATARHVGALFAWELETFGYPAL